MSLADNQNNGENGSSYATLLVAASFTIVLIIICFVGLWLMARREKDFELEMHRKDEANAYRYTGMKDQRNQIKVACDANSEKLKALEIWIKQNTNNRPSPDLLVPKECSAAEKSKEEIDSQKKSGE